MSENASDSNSANGSGHANIERTRLIEERLRVGAAEAAAAGRQRRPSLDMGRLMAGDVGHLHRTHDVAALGGGSRRTLIGPAVRRAKRVLWFLLRPWPEVQTSWNAASARMVTLLAEELAVQDRRIELLEAQLEELESRSAAAPPTGHA